jgi:hypothetical protein
MSPTPYIYNSAQQLHESPLSSPLHASYVEGVRVMVALEFVFFPPVEFHAKAAIKYIFCFHGDLWVIPYVGSVFMCKDRLIIYFFNEVSTVVFEETLWRIA